MDRAFRRVQPERTARLRRRGPAPLGRNRAASDVRAVKERDGHAGCRRRSSSSQRDRCLEAADDGEEDDHRQFSQAR